MAKDSQKHFWCVDIWQNLKSRRRTVDIWTSCNAYLTAMVKNNRLLYIYYILLYYISITHCHLLPFFAFLWYIIISLYVIPYCPLDFKNGGHYITNTCVLSTISYSVTHTCLYSLIAIITLLYLCFYITLHWLYHVIPWTLAAAMAWRYIILCYRLALASGAGLWRWPLALASGAGLWRRYIA